MVTNELIIINIFFQIDEFCKVFIPYWNKYLIDNNKKHYKSRVDTLSESELITIEILYQLSGYKNFKEFYNNTLYFILKLYFPNIPSYKRLISLKYKIMVPLLFYLQYNKGKETGIYYIDSTSLPVCKNQRINNHKTFKDLANRGKTSMGWFYGFKLHLIINDKKEIMNIKITKGNVFDNQVIDDLAKNLKGKLFGDRGYLSKKEKLKELEKKEIILITKSRKNMKIKQEDNLSEEDKTLLSKRNIIETVIGEIKRLTNICTTRIKNVYNYFVNILSSICAYQLKGM